MKLISFSIGNHRGFGVVKNGGIVELTGLLKGKQQSIQEVLSTNAVAEAAAKTESAAPDHHLDQVEFDLPITKPEKIYCVGQNYKEHILEMGFEIPNSPSVFSRYPRTFVPHNGQMIMPSHSNHFDYEGEMAVVIGQPARHVSETEALQYVAGYTICNDGSVRDWQKLGPQVAPGKNWEHSGMLGPWITTADEVDDPQNMGLTTRVNGEVRQKANTGDLVFSAAYLVSYISTFITLMPGDMITTGSPAGVALGFSPPKWLKPGDRVEIEIDAIGTLAAIVTTPS